MNSPDSTGPDPHTARFSPAARGIAFIIASGAFFTLNDFIMKWLRAEFPVGEALAVRGAFALIIFLAFILARGGRRTLKVGDLRGQSLRALCVVVATVCFIGALRYMPLADAIGIAFAGPLFIVALAGPMLGERIGWRRWLATAVGFVGVLAMVRPTGAGFQLAALLPLGTALFGALRDLLTRRLSHTDHSNATLVFSMWAIVGFGALTLPLGWWLDGHAWLWPDGRAIALFALAGFLMGLGQYCSIEALRLAEAGLVAPFKYLGYVWALLLGYLGWGDVPAPVSLFGVALVAGANLYIFWRERRLRRAAVEQR